MRNRFLKTFVLFMSLALAALPVQQAYAAPDMASGSDSDMQASHCQDKASPDSTGQVADFSSASSISHGCCCDHCDANCAPDCGHGMSISAIMLPTTTAITNTAHPVYPGLYSHFTTRSTSPPSPPPLS